MPSWVDQEPQVITFANRQAVSPFGDDVIGQPVEMQVAEPSCRFTPSTGRIVLQTPGLAALDRDWS